MAGEPKDTDGILALCTAIASIDLSDTKRDVEKMQEELRAKIQDTVKKYGVVDAWNRVRSLACLSFEGDTGKCERMLKFLAPMFGPGLCTEFEISYFPTSYFEKAKKPEAKQ